MIFTAARALLEPYLVWIRLAAVIIGALAIAFAVVTVKKWHRDSLALEATEKALEASKVSAQRCIAREASAWQALQRAADDAKAREFEDRAIAERIERELQTRLAAADARGRDLARRLRDATACPGAGAVPGAADPAGQPASAAGEPGSAHGIAEATAALAAACDRDSARLAGWQAWWSAVAAGR